MAFNIQEFKSQGLVYGGARPALFSVAVTPPPQVNIAAASITKFEFTAKSANLPEMTVGSIPVGYFGRKIKVAGDRTFADWSVNVMNDEDFSVRSMFEKWSNAINALVTNTRQNNLITEQYKATMDVFQYGKDGRPIRGYQLIGAFPTSVEAIALDWDTADSIETFGVTIAYDYFIPSIEAAGSNTYRDRV